MVHLASSLAGRAIALGIALAATGAPRVLALATPATHHECRCGGHGGGPGCTCARCALAAHQAAARNGGCPLCHGAAEPADRAPQDGARTCACISGDCSPEDQRAASSADPFLPPAVLRLAEPDRARDRAGPLAVVGEQERAPDVPPPRLD